MEMTALLDDMVSPPQSPGPGQSSALEEAPEVMLARRVKKGGAKRCLLTAFGDQTWPRPPSPDEDPPALMLSPRAVRPSAPERELAAADQGKEKGKADEQEEAGARPCKVLRMQARPKGSPPKKVRMNGGSSAHNAAPLQRTLSVYVPFSPPKDVAAETLFAVGAVTALRSPLRRAASPPPP